MSIILGALRNLFGGSPVEPREPNIFNLDDIRSVLSFHAADFGKDTCYGYIANISIGDGKCAVTIFVKPGLVFKKSGDSLAAVLGWWQKCFETQPNGWDYCQAGWHLFDMEQLPDDVGRVWQ